MAAGRRRRVPAFGEWNYYCYSGELLGTPAVQPASEQWYSAAPELEASSDVWFKYSPPPRRPPLIASRKVRRPGKMDTPSYGSGGGKRGLGHRAAATPARASADAVAPSSAVARAPASKGKAAAGAAARAGVVRPVDEDLYQGPPPEFVVPDDDNEPRRRHKEEKMKKASRSLWMGCFGFNCVSSE